MMNRKETVLAYRCPECGEFVRSAPGSFLLSGDLFRLKCTCTGSELTVQMAAGGKMSLSVPCFSCPRPHLYKVSESLFFGKRMLKIPCQLSGHTLCFVGGEDEVEKGMNEAQTELMEELGDHDYGEFRASRGEKDTYLDPQILDILLTTVHVLNDEEAITCHCVQGRGEYETTITDTGIRVCCRNCDAFKEIPAESLSAAEEFLKIDVLHLN